MKFRFRRGQRVEITFLDHTVGSVTLEFTVLGRVVAVDPKSVTLAYFVHADDVSRKNGVPDNESKHTIVRSAITKVVELVPKADP